MERKYWEKIAPEYNEEIFDVLQNDEQGLITSAIEKVAVKSHSVIDVGCAIGKWLPFLSGRFKKVMAADISLYNLKIAQKLHPTLHNVEYKRADMSARKTSFSGYNVAVCVNAILTSEQKKRDIFFKNLASCLKKGGHLVLVVPALESWLLTHIVQNRYQIDRNLFREKISNARAALRYKNIIHGNAEIDNVPTKHYLGDELRLLLNEQGFIAEQPVKVEYEWFTEFRQPPRWLKDPRPFDWLITARKK